MNKDVADKQNIEYAKKIIEHENWEMSNRDAPIKEQDSRDKEILAMLKKVEAHEREEIKQRHLKK